MLKCIFCCVACYLLVVLVRFDDEYIVLNRKEDKRSISVSFESKSMDLVFYSPLVIEYKIFFLVV